MLSNDFPAAIIGLNVLLELSISHAKNNTSSLLYSSSRFCQCGYLVDKPHVYSLTCSLYTESLFNRMGIPFESTAVDTGIFEDDDENNVEN